MEDEEDVVKSVDVAEQPLLESQNEQTEEASQQYDTGGLPGISLPGKVQGVVEPSCGGGEEAFVDDVTEGRASEVEHVEETRSEGRGYVIVASEAQPVAVVEVAADEAVIAEREKGEDSVDESAPERKDENVIDGAQSVPVEAAPEVVVDEGGEVESVESGNEGGNAEESRERQVTGDEPRFSPVDKVRDDGLNEGVKEETVERETEGQNDSMDEDEVKREDAVSLAEETEAKGEEVVERDAELVAEEVGALQSETEVVKEEEDVPLRGVELVEKVGDTVSEEKVVLMKAKEVEEGSSLKDEEAATVIEEMQVSDEKEKAVNVDELAEEKVDNNDHEKEEAGMGEKDEVKVLSDDELAGEKGEIAKVEELELVEDEKKVDTEDSTMEVKQEDEESKVEEEKLGEGSKREEDEESEEIELSPAVTKDEDKSMVEGEETPIADIEMDTDKSGGSGKKKSGRSAKGAATTPVKTPSKKVVGEDVCYICLDGGNLVLCDRRGCPKAYHPSCIDHDEEFFKTKGRWNCGWHLCNKCGKNAYFMCCTCQFSLCKGCSKDATVFCVRGNKGFCETCMKTIMLIENSEKNEMGHDAFSDTSSWEYLFKDYWLEQKEKLCITSDELVQSKNPWKDSDKQQPSVEVHESSNYTGADADRSPGNLDLSDSRRKKAKRNAKSIDYDTDSSLEKEAGTGKRKPKRKSKSQAKEASSDSEHSSLDTSNKRGKRPRKLAKSRSSAGDSAKGSIEWASKELLEFVMHMKNGDKSVLSQFDVQSLLLEYIKQNKLRDPRRQSQIVCDPMLQKLFGKPRVGHFEMLKLLESHFFLKDDHTDDNQGSVVDTDVSQPDADDYTDSIFDGGRSRGKKSRKRGGDRGLQSNLDDYAAIDMHNINLIFLRRNLMEALMDKADTFHDKVVGAFVRIRIPGSSQKQDIYRLVQITGTCKAAKPYKVGRRTTDDMLEILNLDKTEIISLDIISNQDFTEDECKRLRQSIKCGLINRMTVGDIVDKGRELNEVRVTDWLEVELVRLSHLRDRASEKGRKKELRECVEKLQLLQTPEERQRRLAELPVVHADPKMDPSCDFEDDNEMDSPRQASDARLRETGFSRKGRDQFSPHKGGPASSDSWSANARPPNKKWEPSRSLSGKGFSGRRDDPVFASPTRENSLSNGVDKGSPRPNTREKPRMTSETSVRAEYSAVRSDTSASAVSEALHVFPVAGQTDPKVVDTEKLWHYRDPTSKVQGPFSISQLRKWSNTGYFPVDLRIWRTGHTEGDSILLTNALAGRFNQDLPSSDSGPKLKSVPASLDASKFTESSRSFAGGGRYDSSSLPPPTPTKSQSSSQVQTGNEKFPSLTPMSPSDPSRSNFSRQPNGGATGNRGEFSRTSVGAVQQVSGQQFFPSPGTGPDLSSRSSTINRQQVASQSTGHMVSQQLTTASTMVNLVNSSPNPGQGLSNVIQHAQNPTVYAHGWSCGHVARAESVTASLTPNNPNAGPAQVAYGQWAPANQGPSYGAGYAVQGNTAQRMSGMPSQNAWRPAPTNMAWAGQQQQLLNQNMVWGGPQTGAAFRQPPVAGAVGQHTASMTRTALMPGGTSAMGWSGGGPNPSAGSTNPDWVASPGNNTGGWGGDQNQNGGVQYSSQS